MRKTFRAFAVAALSAALLSSCTITLPVAVSSNTIGSKKGSATGTIFLGVFSFGADASIASAAKKGGITKVATVDMKHTNILGIIHTIETRVTGE